MSNEKVTLNLSMEVTDNTKKQENAPKKKYKTKTSQEGTRDGEIRATFIVKESLLEKIKAVAYWERVQIKTVVNDALESYLSKKYKGKT